MILDPGRRTLALSASLIAVLAWAVPSLTHAQTTGAVTGSVTEPSGRPLAAVVVAVQGLGLSIGTSPTGRYVLSGIPVGPQVLQFRMIGYAAREVTVTITAGTPARVDAVLDQRPIELSAVVVEGVSRAPDRMIDAPAAVDVVRPATGDPVSVTGQIPIALSRVPGLDVVQSGINDFKVNARGFNATNAKNILVLQDGRDVATLLVIRQTWGALSEPFEDLGRIEVMRGPGSALYGPNAYRGVINIITPAARDIVGTKLTLGGGELGTARADLRHAGVLLDGRLGYRVNVGYTRSEDWTRSRTAKDSSDWRSEYAPATDSVPGSPGPEQIPLEGQTKDTITGYAIGTPDPLVTVQGSARADYYAVNGSIVTLEGGAGQVDNQASIAGTGRNQALRFIRPWARLTWDHEGSGVSAWYTGLLYPQPQIRLVSGTPQQNTEAALHLEARTSRTFKGNDGRVVVGASAQNNLVNSQGTTLNLTYDDRSDQYYGAFGQVEYTMRRVRVIGAVRWDNSNLYAAQVSPKGALVFSPAKHHALRFTVGRAFLTPTLTSLFQAAPTGPGVQNLSAIEDQLRADPAIGPAVAAVPNGRLFTNSAAVPESSLGNRTLLPQTMTSYEIGYKGQFGWRAFLSLDAYAAHITNFVTPALPAGTTHLNPKFQPWTAPDEVPAASRADVVAAAYQALAARGNVVQNGLTRLPNGTTAIVLSFGNLGVVDEWGIELGASVALTRTLAFTGSYTWYQYAIREAIPGDPLRSNTPEHKGTVALEYAGRQGITLGVDARIVTGYHWSQGVWDGDIPASQVVNLHAGYRVSPHVRVNVNATNLLDQQRFHLYGGSVIGRRVLAGLTSTF